MQVSNSQDNIKELEAKIQALIFENKDLKTTNQSLFKKAEWLETELAISKHNCTLLKNAIYSKQSEKLKNSYTSQRVIYPTSASEGNNVYNQSFNDATLEIDTIRDEILEAMK